MTLLLEITNNAPYFSTLTLLLGLGFAAATLIGSIAWYNSKRPVGWEDKEKPDIVPDVPDINGPDIGQR
ncbi:MAG: hypothetical protein HC929_05040 [Leptolyngbyaceae cyanobacterium SM2_5_2]|nr:hypothetical protein [Leptolyngbyaceae cyanobacterium SM2_5_2]